MTYISGKQSSNEKTIIIEEHMHSVCKVSPSLVAGITVTGHADAWVLGDFSNDIIAANAVTSVYDVHFINIASASASDTYELVLYYGDDDTEAGRVRITRAIGTNSINPVPLITPIIPKNSRLRAKAASSSGGGDSLVISVLYHTY